MTSHGAKPPTARRDRGSRRPRAGRLEEVEKLVTKPASQVISSRMTISSSEVDPESRTPLWMIGRGRTAPSRCLRMFSGVWRRKIARREVSTAEFSASLTWCCPVCDRRLPTGR